MASFKKMIVNNTDYDVDDPNDVETEGGELADTVINYESATTPTIGSFTQFLDRFTSGTKVGAWFKNFRAGCDFLLHIGSLVNNCVSDNETLPLAAAQGKVLMDLITEANSLIDNINNDLSDFKNSVNMEFYTSLSSIGLSEWPDKVETIIRALPYNSMLLVNCSGSPFMPADVSQASLFILKASDNGRVHIFCLGKTNTQGDYRMFLDGNTNVCTEEWVKLY